MTAGEFTPEETAAFVKNWNAAANFVLQNADTMNGMITVTLLQ